ncbi:hypothetical protein predicted by Glimmer/Critica [Streptococcus dysgalactiae subsp. equisimilis AC-2713]|uniref:Uncharacterized protein n=1 Tax=Streptococcus dysgalactiae subsp. equisimilis AC-2713 TaxID=759913 RepID=A0AB33R6C1_STREQ|nr:hypothetical protein HMPREF9964_0324 [Streptococcus dysgalactiae subsp. equisimilis SK1249]EGR88381.1 hypothetical protein HMPREF9963_1161 [Streptococcus dysgalactiae subsp. equisimilis SK1250]CCI62375.1 hypothetical protein predicted by Glimmer/Critica [Streptococcus dysgalactiae subsp. equisimilis AC-2713]
MGITKACQEDRDNETKRLKSPSQENELGGLTGCWVTISV